MEVEQKKRGPKVKFGPRKDYHLKFSEEVVKFIESQSPEGVQAYFDQLIEREMKANKEAPQ